MTDSNQSNIQPQSPTSISSTGNVQDKNKQTNHLKTNSESKPSAVEAATTEMSPAQASVSGPPSSQHKWVFAFGDGKAEGDSNMRALLGGKGAGLAEMSSLGLPVPPGFTITTEVCTEYTQHAGKYPSDLGQIVEDALVVVENLTNLSFGDENRPLLLSVRSGARASMPGMMDTVLNLGLNDSTVEGLAKQSCNARFAYDSYRRFIQMFGNVVMGIDNSHFEDILEAQKERYGLTHDTELKTEHLQALIQDYKRKVREQTGKDFSQSAKVQLWEAIGAVFRSWSNPRAVKYRKMNSIPDSWGTAVNVQAMVFGNMGNDSATGVAFTRDPSTGQNALYGEYLSNAQGEDVVAGIRTPQLLSIAAKQAQGSNLPSLEEAMPSIYHELAVVRQNLETHFRDVQDIEFTIQEGKLYILQTRTGKRSARAALKVACDMVAEGLITQKEAVQRVDALSLRQLLHPTLDPRAEKVQLVRGLPASPGAVSGHIALNADEAERMARNGDKVILCRIETSPEDVHGMFAAKGVLTARGGMTSHAAVVARGMGRPCIVGASAISINYKAGTLRAGNTVLHAGEVITLDGGTGNAYTGDVPTIAPAPSEDVNTIMQWADKYRKLEIFANAETPADVRKALGFGAQGIGLCRTEHMFFNTHRILAVREMILADDAQARWKALCKILPMQRKDFTEIFRLMRRLPVTIRLLDPPLHEFLPYEDAELIEVAKAADTDVDVMKERAVKLHESNPMLGLRGCRVGIMFPEIYKMQTQAAFEAAVNVAKEENITVQVEIMVPFIATESEIRVMKDLIDEVAKKIIDENNASKEVKYRVGTMIELPRAALHADRIAKHASFFSFGTNDLTQTAFGLSRDDAGSFLPNYNQRSLIEGDPFVTLDRDGVGELVKIAVERGRSTRPDLKLCLCGEQGGDVATVAFCHEIQLDAVSCSPYQVLVARLAAAQAAIENKK